MAETLKFEFEMTPEFARAAVPTLEQALWMQNDRLHEYWDQRMRCRSALRWVAIPLAACGLLLAASGWALMPRDKVFYGAMSSAFAVLLVIFIMLPRIGLALRRFARHMVSITAGKLMRPVAARGPYKIVYELSGTSLVTRAEAVQVSSTLDLRKVRVAIETPDFICAFPSRFAQRPIRVLYLPGPSEHAAMRTALVASGAEMLRVPPGV